MTEEEIQYLYDLASSTRHGSELRQSVIRTLTDLLHRQPRHPKRIGIFAMIDALN
jgi:hypothetical protein